MVFEKSANEAKQEVAVCEKEIGAIKTKLRALGATTSEETGNLLKVSWIKVQNLPETAKPRLSLQLSSPIEEKELTKLFDDSLPEESREEGSGMLVVFQGVEMGQATLTVSAFDEDIPLGSSDLYDMSALSKQLDAMEPKETYQTEINVDILPADAGQETGTTDDATTETAESSPLDKSNEEAGKTVDTTTAPATCTVTLNLVYYPSAKDQREELYELLNKTSQRKAAAVEKLRQLALAASRHQHAAISSGKAGGAMTSRPGAKPAVKAGFLNKKKELESSKIIKLYNHYLGPQSLARHILWGGRNFIIFVGSITFFHFKGYLLTLPPPV